MSQMNNTLFYIIVTIIVIDFVLERVLDYLNSKKWSNKLPDEVADVYDADKYKKQQNYKRVNERFSLITSSFSFVIILLMLFLGGFAFVDNIARSLVDYPILIALVFFGILMLASDIINLPFSLYDIFVIEERFGFNKMTPKTFVLDKLKGYFLAALIGGGILSLIIWIFQLTGNLFWLYAWIVITAFTVFMAMFYSNLIVPLFNKQKPLEEGELRDAINNFCHKVGFKLRNVYVIDGSKRSTKANAYFTGLGTKKRIVLYDTLIKDLSIDEIVAVLAHEIGHYKKKHTYIGLVVSIIQTGVMLYLFSLIAGNPSLNQALGSDIVSFHLALITFGILYSPISLILGLIMNTVSRKNEYEADKYAQDKHDGEHLVAALKKLSRNNLSNLTPHPLYVFFHYSHPTLLQRIKALRANK
jgi:STE24 endopeptidase